jgi:hypothetical protein
MILPVEVFYQAETVFDVVDEAVNPSWPVLQLEKEVTTPALKIQWEAKLAATVEREAALLAQAEWVLPPETDWVPAAAVREPVKAPVSAPPAWRGVCGHRFQARPHCAQPPY